jgi:hypothetical protein
VAPGHELRHQPPPYDPGPACHEHPHNTITSLIPELTLNLEYCRGVTGA